MKITGKNIFAAENSTHFLVNHVVPTLFKGAVSANLMVIGTALILSYLLYDHGSEHVIYWLVTITAISIARLFVFYLYNNKSQLSNSEQLLNVYTFITLLLGICWGATVLLIPDGDAGALMGPVVLSVFTAVFVATLILLSIYLKAYFYNTLPIFFGAIYYGATNPTILNLSLLFIVACITALCYVTAIKMNKSTFSQSSLQERNDGLITNLKHEVKQREKAQIKLVENKRSLENHVINRTEQLLTTNDRLEMEINKRKIVEQSLYHIKHSDPLTNLPNLLLFNSFLMQKQEHAVGDGPAYAVLIVDIKQFDEINKMHGFEVGNNVLKTVGQTLKFIDASAQIARYNNDRFLILLDIHSKSDLTEYSNKVLSLLKDLQIAHQAFPLSAHIGASIYSVNKKTKKDDIIAQADLALANAKATDRNFCLYDLEGENINSPINFIDELKVAIETNQLYFSYQPVISLKTNQVTSFESLLRWQHDAFGDVSPDKIISIAKDAGLLYKIDEFALRNACSQMAIWQAQHLNIKKIAVNFSGCTESLSNIIDNISHILLDTGCKGQWIEIEISEEFIIQASDESLKQIHFLKQLGFSFTVDNFGSGYTSFFKFQQLPINAIKINQILLGQLLETDTTSLDRMLNSIKSISQSFGLLLIVKGIESKEDEKVFKNYGYDFAQGNLYSKPVNVVDVPGFVRGYPVKNINNINSGNIMLLAQKS